MVWVFCVGWPDAEAETLQQFVEDDGNKARGKACKSGWYPCDTDRKFRLLGTSGGELENGHRQYIPIT
jgi:hypothetical protein